jgi:hypothetical protein
MTTTARPTTAATRLHRRIKVGVVAALEALDLPDMFGGVRDETFLDESNLELPCVVASIEGEVEELLGGTTLSRHMRYPVRVFYLNRDVLLPDEEEKHLEWRDRMLTRFDRPPRESTLAPLLPGCPEVCDLLVTPRVIFDEKLPQYKYVVSGFLVKAEAFVPRVAR